MRATLRGLLGLLVLLGMNRDDNDKTCVDLIINVDDHSSSILPPSKRCLINLYLKR